MKDLRDGSVWKALITPLSNFAGLKTAIRRTVHKELGERSFISIVFVVPGTLVCVVS